MAAASSCSILLDSPDIPTLVLSVAALVVLGGDQPPVERGVLGARRLERAGERVESVGDRGELARLGPRQAHAEAALFEVEQTGAERRERPEHAAE